MNFFPFAFVVAFLPTAALLKVLVTYRIWSVPRVISPRCTSDIQYQNIGCSRIIS